MTVEQAKKLKPGDQIMVTTSDGVDGNRPGITWTVKGVDEDGWIFVVSSDNGVITDPRRVDLYRSAPKPQS